MKKFSIFSSIRLKFILFFVLLILLAMEIIGVYFVRELEKELTQNFKDSILNRVNLLTYNLEEEFLKERDSEESLQFEDDVKKLLIDNKSSDIEEMRVYDKDLRVIATSDPGSQDKVGQRTTDIVVTRTFVTEEMIEKMSIDKSTNERKWLLYVPIKVDNEIEGILFIEGKIERVFEQIQVINQVLINGTIIALVFTAIVAVIIAQTITRPITDMKKQAQAMARGNYSRKVKVYGHDEIGQLAITFNNLSKKLQDEQAKTDSEKRKLSSILKFMTDGVISTDRKGRIILINEAAEQMLNVTRETVISENIIDVLELGDKYSLKDLTQEQNSVILDLSTNAVPLIVRVNFSIIQKETGIMNGLIVVLHDITEQEKIERERREFVANVSHELRTPLTTMRSYLEALTDGAWMDKDIAPQFLKVTQNETERMIRLVNDLLVLSKMDSKDYQLRKEWINFPKFLDHIIDRFEMAKEKNVHFSRDYLNEPILVEIDQDKITQVLDNIISNALKYSPSGGTITVKLVVFHDSLEVKISDQGVGIPKQNLHRIFDRFYRVDKARARHIGGTGLGLAIAKEMVEAHNGHIWATSIEGKGTTIHFTLPYDRDQGDDF
ncbi:cell wall metabolism sensor histidine kinase WalK [Caldibacillus thermoamylovorans]|jgi:two-component system, OmpR family, sensor histidine kinase VicK|uniref:cell wall metabolism sensor histidine kinase WalK n=1 Tax=Bacillaceae TaxID=186817 RepID=UPI000BA462E9|nr:MULTISPECIES: cell wall metabolism sensor histidine kinase WalK [Bacillaceae]MCB5935523.1 cell wall metabolism sensor histidine kinase WalK [Bacillus sp. DFI.2.34]NWN97024.1 cell wall metabolism sensor histidine kinase WalK [Bacillus sp. (in: firmicutes)]MCB7076889.1 cell wall metabolism sensor histidine kinase WalK [Caldibacillus thermoamylovorans]MCM3478966.1 cell wall metabolism sensor histidine kinase WalK [Caldibacillus thermoamylovorans]MCM3799810.1 cell wall metabolism sensor histidi